MKKNFILLIKNICPPIIWKFFKKLKFKQKYFGLDNLDQKLEKFLDYNDGYFIEIGANNGKEQSNTFFFEKEKNWRGVLIEPIVHKYLECKKNRSEKNKFYCCACVSEDFKQDYVELLYSNLMTTPINLENDIEDSLKHAEKSNSLRNPEDKIEVVKFLAKAKTMTSILEDAESPFLIDLLSLDVEGSEIEVLKGINFSKYNFKYIILESRNIKSISRFLKSKNYDLIEKLSHHDYLFSFQKN